VPWEKLQDATKGSTRTQIGAKVIAHSIAPHGGQLVTMEFTAPRFILAEINTHRAFSRNAASSRAIPIKTMVQQVLTDPVIPEWIGRAQKGMQASEELIGEERNEFVRDMLALMQDAAAMASKWGDRIHKQTLNRYLEPWMWCKQIVTATDWSNFFWLRCHKDAQPEFRTLARSACEAYFASEPAKLGVDEWHTPYVTRAELEQIEQLFRGSDAWGLACDISVGRCARVSYLTHDGKRDFTKDIELREKLLGSGHWSPFEHVATPNQRASDRSGNFLGWYQYRKLFPSENRCELLKSPTEYATRR
jgi:thymidylate synthase ThyX